MSNDSSSRAPLGAAGFVVLAATFLGLPALGLVYALTFGGPTILAADTVSDTVGGIAAQFRVDESGAATYSIPIYAVPGRAGVTPSLTLSYSSQGGDGPMGKGWSIGGLSTITRCRATREAGDFIVGGVATDGVAEPVDFSAGDRFCLDGQRLVPATDTCVVTGGYTGTSYRTEVDSFSRVCAWGPSVQDPKFFTVARRDGSISWYGDRDSATTAVDGYFNSTAGNFKSYALTWAQTRMQDSAGNTIDYKWIENPSGPDNGELLISEVQYTGKVPRYNTTGTTLAPFTKIVFNYAARAASEWTLGFVAGGAMRSTRYLTSVVSCADMACTGATRARYYEFNYLTSVSNSGNLTLSSVEECRDLNTSCLAPTTFTWSTAKNELVTSDGWQPTSFGSLVKFEGFKLGDVDGDGRPDMVWLKDGSTGETCPTEHIMVSFATFDGTRQTFGTPVLAGCTPSELMSSMGADSWQLFDYNGDGRDDFLGAGVLGANYVIYPATGNAADPFGSTNLLATVPIPVTYVAGAYTNPTHPLLTDFNGDGLLDVMYKLADLTYRVRLMERQGATWGWGAARTISFTTEQPMVCPPEALSGCSYSYGVPVMPDKTRLVDFDGDAASDIIFEKTVVYDDSTVFCPRPNPNDPEEPDCSRSKQIVYTLAGRVKSITSTNIQFTNIGDNANLFQNTILKGGGTNSRNLLFGDINGDGLTDLVYVRANENPEGVFVYALNTGRGFLDYVDIGTVPKSDIARLVDVNGDGRSDLVYVDWQAMPNPWRWRQRPALRSGGFGPSALIPGNQAIACLGDTCDPKQYATMFNDLDGDGALDFFTISFGTSTPNFVRSQSATTAVGKPRDVITSVLNGLGSRTDIQYAALTNGKVHVRRATSRDTFNSGRGAPTLDFIAPSYVVSKASSTAPVDGDPNAMASVYYQYAGARIQAGGRGFLGFEQVYSFDPNHAVGGVVTQTNYEQKFPYTGMPLSTRKSKFSTFVPSSCLTDSKQDTCFAKPGGVLPPFTATTFSLSTQDYESDTESAGTTITAFAPGVQKPVHVRTNGTSEKLSDPVSGLPTSRVETAFTYGANGNVATTQADTYTTWGGVESLTTTLLTSNTYSDTNSYWWLGRLTATTVTHKRAGGLPDIVRNTAFTYDPNTGGMLISERIQPGVVDQDLRKQKAFDVYGNVTASMTCANPSTGCDTSISFHPASANTIERYARTVYDAESRYPIATYEPFWSGTAAVERQTQAVASRDIFGNVTQATDVNGNISAAQYGALGRPYATWTETGDSSTPGTGGLSTTVTYRWCGTGTNRVTCPDGAKYRVRNWSNAGPMAWSYFDALGREVMTVKETLNTAVVNKELSAVCTGYEESGKASRVTNPFFLSGALANIDSLALASVCLGKPSTTTVYDTLGRVTLTTGPDNSSVTTAYDHLTTTVTDARGNQRVELRNGKGELRYVRDALNTQIDYWYNADGTLRSISRTASGTRGAVINSWAYDALGRKTWQSDPDSGVTAFAYNPAGELIAQWDSAGNRVDYDIDARGRTWRKTVKRGDGVVESQATTVYDTAASGVGKVASEEIVGQYMGLVGQAGTEIDFQRTFGYDLMGRPVASTTTIDGAAYSTAVAYDAKSRPFRTQDVSGRWTKTEFSSRGFATAICDSSAGDWTVPCASSWERTQEVDAFGHALKETRAPGGPMSITRTYDALTGRLEQLCANKGTGICDLMNEGYGWDANGNLHTLVKEGRAMETFAYDDLDRLVEAKFGASNVSQAYVYDKLGNICRKVEWTQTHDYVYNGRAGCGADGLPGGGSTSVFGPHQLVQVGVTYMGYDTHGNQVTKTRSDTPGTWKDRGVKYSLDDHAFEIALGDYDGASPIQRTRFWYGPDGARYKREDGGKRTFYIGNVEVIINAGVTTFRRYVGDVVQDVVGGVATTRYAFKDQLGSVVKIVDGNGTVVQTRDFDAFGEKRNPANVFQAPTGPITPEYTTRGFTGHETIDGAYMSYAVHMGGRLYDSATGRFMQPDPVIQAPTNIQNWNAYTYVFNNPLTYTDPTGMWGVKEQNALRMVGAIALSIFTMGASSWMSAAAWASYGPAIAMASGFAAGMLASNGNLRSGMFGAFSALATFGIGLSLPSGSWGNIVANAFSGGLFEMLQGGNFGHGFASAGLTAVFMPNIGKVGNDVARTALGAVIGGSISEATGGNFANGAVSGAIQAAMAGRATEVETDVRQDVRASLWTRVKSWFSNNWKDAVYPEQLRDPKVVAGICEAWGDAQTADKYLRHEEGLFIGTEADGTRGFRRWNRRPGPAGRSSIVVPDYPNGMFQGLKVDSELHLHPSPRGIDEFGVRWGFGPSDTDTQKFRFAAAANGFVVDNLKVYSMTKMGTWHNVGSFEDVLGGCR